MAEFDNDKKDIIAITDDILLDTRIDISGRKKKQIPVSDLSVVGIGISELIPAFRTVTVSTTTDAKGLYRIANQAHGDVLRQKKNSDIYYASMRTAEKKNKFVNLKQAESQTVTTKTVMPVNPALIMVAATLYSIDQKLDDIKEMQKSILQFLEVEKESEIEADVETLGNIIEKYKDNWDNEHFVSGNHKLALDIQRTARKNMISYEKKIVDFLDKKPSVTAENKSPETAADFVKLFRYYRLSMYTYSFASMIEILLSGNFKEENIKAVKDSVENNAVKYRELYSECSTYLEKVGHLSLEANLKKGIGHASIAVGKAIGSIPVIKNGPVDEFLQESGEALKEDTRLQADEAVKAFARLSNPKTSIFSGNMQEIIDIYNKTEEICFDNDNIYLLQE